MALRRVVLVVILAALGPAAAAACVSTSPPPSLSGGDAGTGSSSGGSSGTASSSGGSSSGGSSSGGSSGGSSSGSSSGGSSSGGSSSGGEDGSTTACTWTVSGGATGSGPCTAVGAYAANNSITAFGFVPPSSSPLFSVSVELGTTPAAFQTGTYTPANVLAADGEYYVYDGGSLPSIWLMSDNDSGVDGGFTLTLTSTGTDYVVDGGDSWVGPHGSLSVTLSPGTGATAPVTGTATF